MDLSSAVTAKSLSLEEFNARFEIIREIGAGSSSRVYLAQERLLDRKIALKILALETLDPRLVKRFMNEARATSIVSHPNIVQIYSFGRYGEKNLFLAMEYIEGLSLREYLEKHPEMNKECFSKIFIPVIDALVYLHAKQIIHRDIKPENIMLCVTDTIENVKVLDLGISKIINDGLAGTTTERPLGTTYYMSPEQCAGKSADFRSDIYSLACVMYESLAQRPPFKGATPAQTIYSHLHDEVPELATINAAREIPQMLASGIMLALSKDPSKRPQSMSEFGELITKALGSSKVYERRAQARSGLIIWLASVIGIVAIFAVAINFGTPTTKNPALNAFTPKKQITHSQLLKKLLVWRSNGKHKEALEELRKFPMSALSTFDYPIHHHYLADSYREMGDDENAAKEFQIAIKGAKPDRDDYYVIATGYAIFLHSAGKNDLAADLLKDTIAKAKLNVKAIGALQIPRLRACYADILSSQNKPRQAKLQLSEALKEFDEQPSKRKTRDAVLAVKQIHKLLIDDNEAQEARLQLAITKKQLLESSEILTYGLAQAGQIYCAWLIEQGYRTDAADILDSLLAKQMDENNLEEHPELLKDLKSMRIDVSNQTKGIYSTAFRLPPEISNPELIEKYLKKFDADKKDGRRTEAAVDATMRYANVLRKEGKLSRAYLQLLKTKSDLQQWTATAPNKLNLIENFARHLSKLGFHKDSIDLFNTILYDTRKVSQENGISSASSFEKQISEELEQCELADKAANSQTLKILSSKEN